MFSAELPINDRCPEMLYPHCSANAAMVEASDVSFGSALVYQMLCLISNDENKLTTVFKFPQTSQFTSKTDASPPLPWIVGLGLCLVFLVYKVKNIAT
jgi:hypothetical protein